MLPTLRRTISPNTVLLFDWGWDILLYESLKMICFFWESLVSPRFFFNSRKKSKIHIFAIFSKMIIFFGSNVKLSWPFSTSIKSIDTLFLPHGLSFEIFPFRKWSQIKIWTDKTFLNFNFKTLTSQKCCRPSGGRFPRTPYYSSSWDETSCSTSHWNQIFI